MSTSMADLFGEVIYAYTVNDALEDGTMVRADPALCEEAGYHVPVVFTRAAWAQLVEWTRDDAFNDQAGRLWDVLTTMRRAGQAACRQPGERFRFCTYVLANTTESGRPSKSQTARPVWSSVVAQPMSPAGEGCITIMRRDED